MISLISVDKLYKGMLLIENDSYWQNYQSEKNYNPSYKEIKKYSHQEIQEDFLLHKICFQHQVGAQHKTLLILNPNFLLQI